MADDQTLTKQDLEQALLRASVAAAQAAQKCAETGISQASQARDFAEAAERLGNTWRAV